MLASFEQIARFSFVGILVLGVDFALIWLFKQMMPRLLAVSLAYPIAVAVHFHLNKRWVFRNQAPTSLGQLIRYAVVVCLCWATTVLVVGSALRWLTANVYLAKLIAIPPATGLSFLLMRRFVFTQPTERSASEETE